MKIFLHLLWTAIILLFISCGDYSASDVYAENSGNFTYSITDGTAVVTGYTGEPEFIEIPHEIDGCPVSEISERAFSGCNTLKRIIFPETLRKIGDYGFYACYSLEIAALPDDVESLGEGCFCGCTRLSYMKIPDGLTEIPDSCFRACTNLGEMKIPSNVRKIGSFCFSGCTALAYVSLGENLSEAGERAFFMCSSLESMYIPSSMKKIGREAFGFVPSNVGAAVRCGFTLCGKIDSEADHYAESSGIRFRPSSESIQALIKCRLKSKSLKISEFSLISVIIILAASMFKGKYCRRIKRLS